MMPGTMPEHPTMGVGIARYKFIDSDDIYSIRSDIETQLEIFLPEYDITDIQVAMDPSRDKVLIVQLIVNGEVYVFQDQIDTGTFSLIDI